MILPNPLIRALLAPPEKGELEPECFVPLVFEFFIYCVNSQSLGLAHLESHHQCGQTTDNSQDAENKRQGQRSDKGVEN